MSSNSKIQFYHEYTVRKNTKFNAIKFYLIDKTLSLFIKSHKITVRQPKKILIIRNCKIGDMILTTSLFREIKKNFPSSKLTVIASHSNYPIIEKNKNIDKIILLDFSWKKNPLKTLSNYMRVFKEIKKENYDIGIEAGTMFINMFFMYFSKIKIRTGYFSFNGGRPFLTHPIEYKTEIHSSISELELVKKALGIKINDYSQEIITDKNDVEELNNFLKKHDIKKFICIVPDASFEKKQWALEKFDKLIKFLNKKYPLYKIIIVGSDDNKISWLVKRNPSCISLIKGNLRVNYLLFKKSSLVIAHDGAPMHLSWIADANLIALIPKHMNLKHIGPSGQKSHVIYKEMKDISVEDVEKEISKILK